MTELLKLDESASNNERSLKTLLRSIKLSQGHFSLILVRCNYEALRQQIACRLREESALPIQEIVLWASVKTLYTTLLVKTRSFASIHGAPASALTIFGLETVEAIDELLASTNQVRDEFRKNFSFPLVVWVTEDILGKMIRLAPDFKSWAATTIKFEMNSSELLNFLHQQANAIFTVGELYREPEMKWRLVPSPVSSALSHSALSPINTLDLAIGSQRRRELEFALQDLQNRGQQLEASLKASLQFALGRDYYVSDRTETALIHYQQSLAFWQQEIEQSLEKEPLHSSFILRSTSLLEKQGTVQFHIALCHCLQATRNPVANRQHWQQARIYLEQSRESFEQAARPDLVAAVATKQGEVLQHLEAWSELQALAETSLQLHFIYGTFDQLAQDYGFLALVALQACQWQQAGQLAELALAILEQADRRGEAERGAFSATGLAIAPNFPILSDDRASFELEIQRGEGLRAIGSQLSHPGSASTPPSTPTSTFRQSDRSFYLLLLAQSLRPLGQWEIAVHHLELAVKQTEPKYDPRLYINILSELRSLYFERGEYLQAFRIKKTQRSIEYQYGFRAFIGASQLQSQRQAVNPSNLSAESQATVAEEMTASCRQQDINRLLERMSRDDHKLTIIHGPSGVGKSSLVNAGLVPALRQITPGGRDVLPVVVQVYTDWVLELEKAFNKAFETKDCEDERKSKAKKPPEDSTNVRSHERNSSQGSSLFQPGSSGSIVEELRKNAQNNLLTVLIFDQFEEFFFISTNSIDRQCFYEFLRNCLNLPFVKVIFSMREDYLHYLLECDRLPNLDAINNNILDKQIRYQLRDFSIEDAHAVVQHLTQRAEFYLEPALIDTFVQDLAGDRQEVRPIELQVVGAQLQEERITTLEEYLQLGANPKSELVKRSLDRIIQDCGPEHEDGVWKLLFSLTDERGVRLIKTKNELASVINHHSMTPSGKRSQDRGLAIKYNIDLILEILVGHGLLFLLREAPEDRYQLVHDYLVRPIRQRFGLEARLYRAEADKKMSQEQLYRANRRLKQLLAFAVVGVLLLTSTTLAAANFWRRAVAQKQMALAQRQRAEINTLTAASEALYFSNNRFDALMESLRAGKQWRQIERTASETATQKDTEILIAAALQQTVYGVKERNRLEGHGDVVWSTSFSPDGQTIASASTDKTIKLWRRDGSLQKTLKGHTDYVASVAFSPDGELLVSASFDKTIKLWGQDGQFLRTIQGHKQHVVSVNFSPDSQLLASASGDKTVKLWKTNGKLVRTLVHPTSLNWVSFSPDGKLVATGGNDGIIRLWGLDGSLITSFWHTDSRSSKVYSLSFSPDGQLLASVGEDKTVKVWDLAPLRESTPATSGKVQPTLLKTLRDHGKWVFSVSFSPDGRTLASAGADNVLRLWSVKPVKKSEARGGRKKWDIRLLRVFGGHGDKVTQVNFSPDGRTLASASYDKTVRLWRIDDVPPQMLNGHSDRVQSVSFSPDGGLLASGAADQTIKLWSRTGLLLKTLTGHIDRVAYVNFSPDGEFLASASYDKTVKLWRIRDEETRLSMPDRDWRLAAADWTTHFQQSSYVPIPLTLRGHTDSVMSVKFSPDGQLIASASKDKTIKLWNRTGELLKTLKGHTAWVTSVSFSPDGSILASGSDDGTVKLWNRQGQLIRTLNAHNNFVLGVSFSPDGKLIASAGYDNTVKLWTLEGQLVATLLKGSSDSATSVSFSPDGTLIASASYDSQVKLWSHNGTLLKTLRGHRDSVMSISFSPDGKSLASASRDKSVILWNLDLDDLLLRGCNWVQDYLKTNPNVSDRDRHLCDGLIDPQLN